MHRLSNGKILLFYGIALLMVAGLFVFSLQAGAYTLSFAEIQAAFHPNDKNYFTLMEYRLPRALLAIVIGGALAMSGVYVTRWLHLIFWELTTQQAWLPCRL